MKTLFLLSLILSPTSFAQGDLSKPLSMSDVMHAFTWIKIAPELPVMINTEGDDQISFRFFDDVYTIDRGYDQGSENFKVTRVSYTHGTNITHTEKAVLDSMLIEKILKFANASHRERGELTSSEFEQSIQADLIPSGFQASKTIYQCNSDLPARNGDGTVFNKILNHTWIQNGASESFGMPNTDEATYFGGVAHLRTPDSFIGKGPKQLKCSPVLIPDDQDEAKISKNVRCIAKSLSLAQTPIFESPMQDWVANFDYHALERNCLMAVRFVLECAGAKASQIVNDGIGGAVDYTRAYSVTTMTPSMKESISGLQDVLQSIRTQDRIDILPPIADALMDLAIEIDSKIRGASGDPAPKNLQEICTLARQNCSN